MNWRGAFNIKYSGDLALDTSNIPSPIRPLVPTADTGTTTFKFPDIFGVGIAVNPTDKLLLSVDFHYLTWSRYDKYVVDFTVLPDLHHCGELQGLLAPARRRAVLV